MLALWPNMPGRVLTVLWATSTIEHTLPWVNPGVDSVVGWWYSTQLGESTAGISCPPMISLDLSPNRESDLPSFIFSFSFLQMSSARCTVSICTLQVQDTNNACAFFLKILVYLDITAKPFLSRRMALVLHVCVCWWQLCYARHPFCLSFCFSRSRYFNLVVSQILAFFILPYSPRFFFCSSDRISSIKAHSCLTLITEQVLRV